MEDEVIKERYFLELAAAFVQGRIGPMKKEHAELFRIGLKQGLKLHKFKRTNLLRVQKVLGILSGIYPKNLLDIGSGRGAFLWPLLDRFPQLQVTAVDILERRVDDINAVQKGGIDRVSAVKADIVSLNFPNDQFDVTCALEVLEHLVNPDNACREIIRVTRRFILVSVPSKPDNNEEHIHLFTATRLEQMLKDAGARSVDISFVPNHMVAIGRVCHA